MPAAWHRGEGEVNGYVPGGYTDGVATTRRARASSDAAKPQRVFLLSPARCDGERAEMMLSPRAAFPLACRLREPDGAPLGEVMSFLSSLYFRGKLAYAEAFARPASGVFVITQATGLQSPSLPLTAGALRQAARVDIDAANPRYRKPLEASAGALAALLRPTDEVVLLGSIASSKYVDVLTAIFGERLLFPLEFVGRGDMSRGGLLLRCARAGVQLTYIPVLGATRTGTRAPKLPPLARAGEPIRDAGAPRLAVAPARRVGTPFLRVVVSPPTPTPLERR